MPFRHHVLMGIDTAYVVAKATSAQARTLCPACGPMRKNKHDRTLSITRSDDGSVMWQCWHCGETGKTVGENKHMSLVAPIRKIEGESLNDDAFSYLEARGISRATAEKVGLIYSSKWFRKSQSEKPSIGFVYSHNDNPYACKWRCIEAKEFTQEGAAATLYLADKLTDHTRVVITEGELDAVSFWEAGIEAVSIPSGAITSSSNDTARLQWIQAHDQLLANATSIYLAVDMDGPGQTTAQELARRLGKLKCFQVVFPGTNKDANDTLVNLGKDALAKVISDAKPWPIEGVSQPNDFYDKVMSLYRNGLPAGKSTGWPSVDNHFTLNQGNLVILTGIPGHGKSTFLDAMLVNAMKQHDYCVAYASFENPPEIHISKLLALKSDKPFGTGPTPRMDQKEMEAGLAWINQRVTFLTHDGVMPTVDSLIERFETAVRRMGVKVCVVDPFNFLKLNGKDGSVDTEAINEMLSKFKMFAQRCEVTFFLVAHPAKPMAAGKDWVPTGYSISGSAHFYNRADFGLTMHREGASSWLHVWKCRFAHQGSSGKVELIYQKPTGNFVEPMNHQTEDGSWLDTI